nr:hypothetical protein [Tanacetum cinerariifolium]
ADGAQSSRVPVLLPEDPYEAIRQAYLVGMDTESKPFEGEAETPELPHIVAPPTCHVEVSEGSGTFGVRSTSSDSTAPLSPDHQFIHTTPALVPIIYMTACMAVHGPPTMPPSLSAVRKRYRGTSELILDTDSEEDEEVDKHLDSDSKSAYAEDEGPTVEDEDPTAGDEGLAAGDEDPCMGVESLGLDDESRGLDEEGHSVESDGFGKGSRSAPEPERSKRVSAHKQPTLVTCTDPEDGIVYIDVPAYPPPSPSAQTPPSPEWSSGLFPISPAPSIVPSPILSPMISLVIQSYVASHVATSTTTIPVDKDQFIKTALQQELHETRGRITVLEQERDRRER